MMRHLFISLLLFISLFAETLETTTRVMMGTFVTIKAPADASQAVEGAFGIMEAVDRRFSTYRPDSEVSTLNRTGTSIPSPELQELLAVSGELYRQSGGSFDITVGGYTKTLYRFGEESAQLPTEAALKQQSRSVGFGHIRYDGKRLRLDPGTQVDFGGIAKGYAVEKAAAYLKKKQVNKAVIAASGDIFCMHRCEIGITDPFEPERLAATFTTALPHTSVSTSGTYRRFVKDSDHSHLLNPVTGRSQRHTASITLIARDANTRLDGMATAAGVMDKEAALSFLDSRPDIAYFIIYTDGSTFASPDLSRFAQNFRLHSY